MHAGRVAYYVMGEGVVAEPEFFTPAAVAGATAAAPAPAEKPKCQPFKFGRLFTKWGEGLTDAERLEAAKKIAPGLIALGKCMDNPGACGEGAAAVAAPGPSNIPAGYTYLGQFIAHEITFDNTQDLSPVLPDPDSLRSPSLDLDSLYGAGPDEDAKLYDNENPARLARLKVGPTHAVGPADTTLDNDLPRDKETKEAIIGDPRNDENLPVAQTHLAFIKFHNRVVADLEAGVYRGGEGYPPGKLFETARAEVVRHFQWIVLRDYLPRLVKRETLDSIISRPELYKPGSKKELFMPLEFSAAAFRFGHSMVRLTYNWNRHHTAASLNQLFSHTKFSGNLNGHPTLHTDWVIDWKRFYDFSGFAAKYPYEPLAQPQQTSKQLNMAGQMDTLFELRLETITNFKHLPPPQVQQPDKPSFHDQKAITVRNLLRGLGLRLPWGEDVADALQEERLTHVELRRGPHAKLLDAEALGGKTPLWFYILKEAKEKGEDGKLGPVGGRIVAETLVGLIRHSDYSILREAGGMWELSDWRPAYGRPQGGPDSVLFEMPDLLRAADVVDALGRHLDS